jgi:hypothetical protein
LANVISPSLSALSVSHRAKINFYLNARKVACSSVRRAKARISVGNHEPWMQGKAPTVAPAERSHFTVGSPDAAPTNAAPTNPSKVLQPRLWQNGSP